MPRCSLPCSAEKVAVRHDLTKQGSDQDDVHESTEVQNHLLVGSSRVVMVAQLGSALD